MPVAVVHLSLRARRARIAGGMPSIALKVWAVAGAALALAN